MFRLLTLFVLCGCLSEVGPEATDGGWTSLELLEATYQAECEALATCLGAVTPDCGNHQLRVDPTFDCSDNQVLAADCLRQLEQLNCSSVRDLAWPPVCELAWSCLDNDAE